MSRFEKYKPKGDIVPLLGVFVLNLNSLGEAAIATNSKLVGKITLKDFVPLFKTFKMQPK